MRDKERSLKDRTCEFTHIETVRQALEELKSETITLLDNIKVLETELDKIETDADAKNYDDLADKLTSGFKHIEIF